MKYLFIFVMLICVNTADAQFRKPSKSRPRSSVTTKQVVKPKVYQSVPNPVWEQIRMYQMMQYQLSLQYKIEQQRLFYLRQLEFQRLMYWLGY